MVFGKWGLWCRTDAQIEAGRQEGGEGGVQGEEMKQLGSLSGSVS